MHQGDFVCLSQPLYVPPHFLLCQSWRESTIYYGSSVCNSHCLTAFLFEYIKLLSAWTQP
ncbi:MAG: hypothetical protein K0U86_22150 [Planctomycetes bacterium]|nr:hypothetical protein [Planctomycetota bacterium]MCH9727611.1 hypothetical protein [Planctomycetota bacterium]MCH9777409.1 hypothetical protein [Planctomycetota bacterium]MCH9792009.1 hypothetical protein [Planctomycetota bacterium]